MGTVLKTKFEAGDNLVHYNFWTEWIKPDNAKSWFQWLDPKGHENLAVGDIVWVDQEQMYGRVYGRTAFEVAHTEGSLADPDGLIITLSHPRQSSRTVTITCRDAIRSELTVLTDEPEVLEFVNKHPWATCTATGTLAVIDASKRFTSELPA